MTDNEIIKALECCPKGIKCEECPLLGTRDCMSKLYIAALDLINRQKSEIERLKKANESFSCMGKMYSEIKSEARKEVAERLKERATKTKWISGGELVEKDYKISRVELDNLLAEMEERECN